MRCRPHMRHQRVPGDQRGRTRRVAAALPRVGWRPLQRSRHVSERHLHEGDVCPVAGGILVRRHLGLRAGRRLWQHDQERLLAIWRMLPREHARCAPGMPQRLTRNLVGRRSRWPGLADGRARTCGVALARDRSGPLDTHPVVPKRWSGSTDGASQGDLREGALPAHGRPQGARPRRIVRLHGPRQACVPLGMRR